MAHPILLKNRFLVARFSPESGQFLHLSEPGKGRGLVKACVCRYLDLETKQWHSDEDSDPSEGRFQTADITTAPTFLTVRRTSEHLQVTLRYELEESSPLLKIVSTVKGTGRKGKLDFVLSPRIDFQPGFNDAFEDEKDLFFDGAELGEGLERPCWRVFFHRNYQTGLLLATRNKRTMAQMSIEAFRFGVQPHLFTNYSTALIRQPFDSASQETFTTSIEIGPWSRKRHSRILRAAKLNQPVACLSQPARGKPKTSVRGLSFYAIDLASPREAGPAYHPRRWMVASMPWAQKGKALFATTGVQPPDLTFFPNLQGLHRIVVGIGNGGGATLKISAYPETIYRLAPNQFSSTEDKAFEYHLMGTQRPQEVDFGVVRMNGKKLKLGRFPDLQMPCVLDYIRFEPLSSRQARKWELQQAAEPALPLSGLADIPDISIILDAQNPDIRAFSSVIWEHANNKIQRIYWRMDGQCSDYPSKINTMRYISAKVHGVFSPHSKAYGRALKKVDILQFAVKTARKYNVSLWGWMRFNSYMGNVMSDFYKNNPRYWEEWEGGRKGGKLCLAWKAVRDHKIGILVEAAKYGLEGLCLGFLRHPPVVMYAKIMRDAYRRQWGKEPPRDPDHSDSHHRYSLADRGDDEYLRWWRFRAHYVTKFGRELKKALKEEGLEHIKIAIWVRPNHCLFDGIDLPTWLEEGLCDEVISAIYVGKNPEEHLYWEKPDWKKMVCSKVPLIREIPPYIEDAPQMVKRILAEGYGGICSYESNATVMDTAFIHLFRSLRTP